MPEQIGSGPVTGPEIVNGSPQKLVATGGVGTTCASLKQATVEPPSGGNENEGGEIV
jgi:hypothetical protein